jgi:hypothetical protein
MDQRFSDKSRVELPYFTRLFLSSKTVQKLYKRTRKGKIFYILSYIHGLHGPVTRKLTEKLREAYPPLAEGCCKAILTTLSSSIAELNSGTGTFSGFLHLLLERNLNADADVRSLTFLSRLTEALHASPFCSYLKCETLTGIGTCNTS